MDEWSAMKISLVLASDKGCFEHLHPCPGKTHIFLPVPEKGVGTSHKSTLSFVSEELPQLVLSL